MYTPQLAAFSRKMRSFAHRRGISIVAEMLTASQERLWSADGLSDRSRGANADRAVKGQKNGCFSAAAVLTPPSSSAGSAATTGISANIADAHRENLRSSGLDSQPLRAWCAFTINGFRALDQPTVAVLHPLKLHPLKLLETSRTGFLCGRSIQMP